MTDEQRPVEQAGNRLDPWYASYAERAQGLSASEVRALFAVASRPEVVSLAGGSPFVEGLPNELVRNAADTVIRDHAAVALQYGSGQGIGRLREQICEIMAVEGVHADPDDVVITVGSQQAIDLITKLFINPGDAILAESPSYVGALGVFRSYQANVVHVAMDEDGLIPEALEETIGRLRAEGRPIKFLYTVPAFHNPAGVTMSLERRHRIIQICRENEILIAEDNPYGQLYYDHPAPPPLRTFDGEGVIYLGTFSKILAAGMRIGWIVAPPAIRDKLVLAQESAVLSPSVFSQMVVSEYLEQSDWQGQIATFRDIYRERRDAMIGALEETLPSMNWTTPNGGFFVWLTLPEVIDSKQMLPRAVSELVAYTPGTAFYYDGRGRHAMRLSFCLPTPDRIRLGVRRLAGVIGDELDLLETFGKSTRDAISERRINNPPPNLP